MKKLLLLIVTLILVLAVGQAFAAKQEKGMFSAKPGDEIYVCACGAACTCGTMGHKPGNCGCGQKMVPAKVTKVEKGRVYYTVDGKEMSAPQKGKYMCGCGAGCPCGYVSQKAGDCGCGKPMMKVK